MQTHHVATRFKPEIDQESDFKPVTQQELGIERSKRASLNLNTSGELVGVPAFVKTMPKPCDLDLTPVEDIETSCFGLLSGEPHARSILNDATLRRGDAIMTSKGMVVFESRRSRAPHAMGDFVALNQSRSLTQNTLLELINIQRASTNAPERDLSATASFSSLKPKL